jgi:4-hydroxythreonine-4-phosphate dehydrogenase
MDTESMIGITLGDPAGVGPEITLKAVAAMTPEERAQTRIFGCLTTLQACEALIHSGVRPGEDVAVTDLPVQDAPLPFGQADARCGDAAFRFVEAAVKAAMAGQIGCIVTAPLNKAALNAAGHHYDGHTGMLAALTGQ